MITVTFVHQVGKWSLLAISIIVLDGDTTLCAGMASIFKSHFFENHKNEVSSITTLSGSSTYLYQSVICMNMSVNTLPQHC